MVAPDYMADRVIANFRLVTLRTGDQSPRCFSVVFTEKSPIYYPSLRLGSDSSIAF